MTARAWERRRTGGDTVVCWEGRPGRSVGINRPLRGRDMGTGQTRLPRAGSPTPSPSLSRVNSPPTGRGKTSSGAADAMLEGGALRCWICSSLDALKLGPVPWITGD